MASRTKRTRTPLPPPPLLTLLSPAAFQGGLSLLVRGAVKPSLKFSTLSLRGEFEGEDARRPYAEGKGVVFFSFHYRRGPCYGGDSFPPTFSINLLLSPAQASLPARHNLFFPPPFRRWGGGGVRTPEDATRFPRPARRRRGSFSFLGALLLARGALF